MDTPRLRFKATDAEDLAVLAAYLQDAVVPFADMTYLPAERRFIMVANRFRWETAGEETEEGRIYERIHCGLCFERIDAVRIQGIDRRRAGQILSLLTIAPGDGFLDLVFAADRAVRLECTEIRCYAEDVDEPWPTQWRPGHPVDMED
jgi:Protein of unknown function (DUF2948)